MQDMRAWQHALQSVGMTALHIAAYRTIGSGTPVRHESLRRDPALETARVFNLPYMPLSLSRGEHEGARWNDGDVTPTGCLRLEHAKLFHHGSRSREFPYRARDRSVCSLCAMGRERLRSPCRERCADQKRQQACESSGNRLAMTSWHDETLGLRFSGHVGFRSLSE